jgi:hypothetical protein
MSDRIPWPRYLGMVVAGTGMFVAGLVTVTKVAVPLTMLLVGGGAGLTAVGGRLWLVAFLERHGPMRIPMWVVLVILLGLLSILPIVALVSAMQDG